MRRLLKRWWFWTATALIAVALVAGYLLIPVDNSQISQTNCDKIQPLMSPAQVMSILGQHSPPAGYSRSQDWNFVSASWSDEDGNTIDVYFDGRGVQWKNFTPSKLWFLEQMQRRIVRQLKREPMRVTCTTFVEGDVDL